MTIVVADTSVLVAAVDSRDRNHGRCVDTIRDHARSGIVVPVTVAVEVDYLLRNRVSVDSARRFLADVDAGRYILEPIDSELFAAAVAIDAKFADLDIGVVDGTVAAVARRWAAAAILTLDDHYRVIAPDIEIRPE